MVSHKSATIWSAKKAESGNTDAYIPVKMNDPRLADVTKYGGVTTIAVAGYTLLEYKAGGKTVRSLEALPIYLGGSKKLTEEQMVEYFSNVLQQENKEKVVSDVIIRKKMIPSGSLIKYNGFYYYLAGKTGDRIILISAVQLCLPMDTMLYIKKIEKACSTGNFEEKDKNGKQVLSKQQNEFVYELIIQKYQQSIFKKKVGAIGDTIIEKEKNLLKYHWKNNAKS